MSQDWSCCEGLLEAPKSCSRRIRPGELDKLSCECSEGGGQGGVVANELPVEVGEAQERLHLLDRARDKPVEYGRHLGWIHADASLGNQVTDECHFRYVKLALLDFCIELVVADNLKDCLDMLLVLGRVLRVDDDVV